MRTDARQPPRRGDPALDGDLPPPGPVTAPPPPADLLDRLRAGWAACARADPAALDRACAALRARASGPSGASGVAPHPEVPPFPGPDAARSPGGAVDPTPEAALYGCVAPGDPRRAALMVRVRRLRGPDTDEAHGAMWSAALVAAAFTAPDAGACVAAALRHVPTGSPTSDAVCGALVDRARGLPPPAYVPGPAGTAGEAARCVAIALLWPGAVPWSAVPLAALVGGLVGEAPMAATELTRHQLQCVTEVARHVYLLALSG